MKVCSYFNGGDCVTIEQYVFALLADCGCKYTKNIPMKNEKYAKNAIIPTVWLMTQRSGKESLTNPNTLS